MKNAMISQPMGGKTEKEINEIRDLAIATLVENGYKVLIKSAPDEWYREDEKKVSGFSLLSLYYIGKSLEKMSGCDAVYFCKGWENALVCRIEHEAAKAYGLEILYEEE